MKWVGVPNPNLVTTTRKEKGERMEPVYNGLDHISESLNDRCRSNVPEHNMGVFATQKPLFHFGFDGDC